MHDEQDGHNPALTELRRRLNDGRVQARLTHKQLVARTGLGRTSVSQALSAAGPVPSARTVADLARVLRLPGKELLDLRRNAAGEVDHGGEERPGPGRLIGEWEPHALEVHPAGPGPTAPGSGVRTRALPGYVRREHDHVLASAVQDAAAGRSGIVVLVGDSSTGKTRACWQAIQPLADLVEQEWRLWHPFDPTRAEAALEELSRVGPRTVVWLNESQHYFGDRATGEQIAAAVHQLLIDATRAPILVLGTLWPEYAATYTALPSPGEEDPHSRVRELLAGHTLTVPDAFDTAALAEAVDFAEKGDRLLADTLTRARTDGRVTQDLAGAPALLNRYQHASPAARALLEAAMDARRLGAGFHLPQAFLTDAATDYLTESEYDQLTDDWAEHAYAQLAEPVHGKQAPLRRTSPRPPRRPPTPSAVAESPVPAPSGPLFRLADYLEQHGRIGRRDLCPPASFWYAAHAHITHPEELSNLSRAAADRYRLQWAHHLRHRAAEHGNTGALYRLAVSREKAGDREVAEDLYREAADHGNTGALYRLAAMRGKAGDREGAEGLYREAAARGEPSAVYILGVSREKAGDYEGAEGLYREAADYGDTQALYILAVSREKARDREGAQDLYREAADHGEPSALYRWAEIREEAGEREGAQDLYQEAAARGDTYALCLLAALRKEAGDYEGAEGLYREAADYGDTQALRRLAAMREEAGDREGAEASAREAAARGDIHALGLLAAMREKAGDREGAEASAREAAARGDTNVLRRLAVLREESGDREGAEGLAREAIARGDIHAMYFLAVLREKAGDREGAEALYRHAADRGDADILLRLPKPPEVLRTRWSYGLDPDGTPTSPWQPSVSTPLNRYLPPRMS